MPTTQHPHGFPLGGGHVRGRSHRAHRQVGPPERPCVCVMEANELLLLRPQPTQLSAAVDRRSHRFADRVAEALTLENLDRGHRRTTG